ncbi:hypothetical protein BSU01_14350 [Erwinia billingiae]|uniref:hypothetical protein n=1 Tax=Erwinia billingiae TaxID=182337 RepID=UPI0019D1C0DD|nr:hypothetical protein [Erwinia billingiae]MBN7122881.1 hypothetical protein [Erwinia billingiae]
MQKLINFLKNLFIHPKEETTQMTDQIVEMPAVAEPVVADSLPVTSTTGANAKAGVADLDAALNFIESGVAQLGAAAKDELKELAKKYL